VESVDLNDESTLVIFLDLLELFCGELRIQLLELLRFVTFEGRTLDHIISYCSDLICELLEISQL